MYWIGYALVGLVGLVGVGATYQAIATARDRQKHPPPGRLVDVGGYRLHLYCAGEGRPTVVMDAGRGNWSLFWSWVQPEVEKFTCVCTYDRAGLGWSDPGPKPRTSQQMVTELNALLRKAGTEGPYVLVAHSAAGYNVRLYTHQFPDEVAGMVLVDVTHENGHSYLSREMSKRLKRMFNVARMTAPLGLIRLVGNLGLSPELESLLKKFPTGVQAMTRAIYYRSQTSKTAWDELDADQESRVQVRGAGSLGDKPLVVLTALGEVEDDETKPVWLKQHADLARLSSQSTRIIAERSSHYIQLDRPDLVVGAIRQVVEAVRRGM